MITLRLDSSKHLSIVPTSATKIFNGETKFEQIKIIVDKIICDRDISDYDLELRIFNEIGEYIPYSIKLSEADNWNGYVSYIDITWDITSKAQKLKLLVKIAKDDVVAFTNYVEYKINPKIDGSEIIPRGALIKKIKDLEAKIDSLDADILELLGVDDDD